MEMPIFLFIAFILLSTKVLAVLMLRMHMPQVIGALIAGVLLGPAVFNLVQPCDTLSEIAQFGVIFLLFTAGMETDFKQLRNTLKSSLLISVLGVVLALGGGFAVAFLFGEPSFESFFIGVVIASMSTSITVEALQEMGKLKTKTGTAILGASLFDDIFAIVILAMIMGTETGGASFSSIGMTLLKIIIFFVLAVVAGMGINRLFNYMDKRTKDRRMLSVFAIAYCFFMAYLAEQFGLADITGAYIAGIAFCTTRCVEYLEEKTHVLSYMLFTPVFLANIGIQTSFDGMNGRLVLFTVLLVAASLLSKLIGCGAGAKLSRFTNRESMQVGVGMMARGEVSIIIAGIGIGAGYMSSRLFSSIIIVVIITVLVTPLLLKVVYKGTEKAHEPNP
jgi:Kef-type K+ transport system membrane component KefB